MEGETNRHCDRGTNLEQDISIHIFTVSSAMGVCLTVIGLIRVVITLGRADTLADDFLARGALLFLTSCLLLIGRCVRARCAECIVWKRSQMESLSSP
jgi:branched-subunit amino acid permease